MARGMMRGWICGALTLLACCAGVAAEKAAEKRGDDCLAGLVQGHPRLLMKAADLAALKARHAADPALRRMVGQVLADADKQRTKPPLRHVIPDGKRLLDTSRDCLRRTLALGFAWRWTKDRKYAAAGVSNLVTVCAFSDWNPSHFLDTAEMANAVGIGYDWFYDAMTPAQRETVRRGLLRLGLEAKGPERVFGLEHNWNLVCNGGLVVAALAVAETDPEVARAVIGRAVAKTPLALKNYAPDGAWMEGPAYWAYATDYLVFMCAAMDSALGRDFGLSKMPGVSASGYFPIYTVGPSGIFLCFADAGRPAFNAKADQVRGAQPVLFWLARRFGNADFSDSEHAVLEKRKASPLHVVWYRPPTGKPPARTLDRFFDGRVPLITMRGAWDDGQALWCGVKAGFNAVNHGHLDLGNFELEAGGVRWAIDLGADNYNMPGYFGKQRWSYYRTMSESHNVPLIDGKGQLPAGVAKVLEALPGAAEPSVTIDLSSAYAPPARKVVRTVALTDRRTRSVVVDRFTLDKPAPIVWGMTTDAEIVLRPDGSAQLTRNGKILSATVLEPRGARFSVGSAAQEAPQNPNTGIRRLLLQVAAPAGDTTIRIRFAPVAG